MLLLADKAVRRQENLKGRGRRPRRVRRADRQGGKAPWMAPPAPNPGPESRDRMSRLGGRGLLRLKAAKLLSVDNAAMGLNTSIFDILERP